MTTQMSERSTGTPRSAPDAGSTRLPTSLALLSLGLGVAQWSAPGALTRLVGAEENRRSRSVMRGLGVREMASGVGILSRPRSAPWVYGRLGGDAMDLALLGRTLLRRPKQRRRTGLATAAVAGVTALDLLCSRRLSRQSRSSAAVPAQDADGAHDAAH